MAGSGGGTPLNITGLRGRTIAPSQIRRLNLDSFTVSHGTIDNMVLTGLMTMPGEMSAISAGITPPTSASAGTGIWFDRTGIYGLASNVKQFYLDATTGGALAGGGKVVTDSTGLTLLCNATVYTAAESLKFKSGIDASSLGYVTAFHSYGSWRMTRLYCSPSPSADEDSEVRLEAEAPATYDAEVQLKTVSGGSQATFALNCDSNGVTGATCSTSITGTQLISNIAVGTAPLAVTSTTVVPNLNVDKVDGYDISQALATTDGPTFDHVHVTTPASGNLVGSGATAGAILRCMYVLIEDATEAAHIKCSTVSQWNGDANAAQDNIGKDAVDTGVWNLVATGRSLKLLDAGITGTLVGVLAAHLLINFSATALTVNPTIVSSALSLRFYNAATGADVDLTTLVDTGMIYVQVLYLTTA
jgi:hypothetical protein